MEASPKPDSGVLPPLAAGSKLLNVQPDSVLCKLCMRGSDDAFAVLHARYHRQVFAFVFHLLGRPGVTADAEDLTQEIFSKAFSGLRSRSAEGSFKSWLFVIARNHTFDHIRARRPGSLTLDDEGAGEPAEVLSIAAQVEQKHELAWLVDAVAALPERQREALVLRELGGMSYVEIADALDTNQESAKQLIKRGRATVSSAAERDGYRSRNLSKELAMAAPIVPLAALGMGATAGSASAAAAAGGGFGLFAGGKAVATVLAVAAVGTGAVVTGERVAASNDDKQPPAATGSLPANASSSVAEGAGLSIAATRSAAAEAAERRAERAAAKRRAKAKAKAAKAKRAKAKRVKARRAAKAKVRANANAQSNSQSAARGSNGSPGANSGSTQAPKKAAPDPAPAPAPSPGAGGKGNGGGPKAK